MINTEQAGTDSEVGRRGDEDAGWSFALKERSIWPLGFRAVDLDYISSTLWSGDTAN